jgi:hypothetical protein
MRDWRGLVEQRLKGIRLTEQESAEVSEELSDHLQSVYETSAAEGLAEPAAVERALREVSNWQELRTKIESSRKKEPTVNQRVSQFWFPAFLSLFLARAGLMLIQTLGPVAYHRAAAIGPRTMPPGAVYAAWLITLPFVGALATYLSRRAGGRASSSFWAVTFPVFPFLAFLVIGLPLAIALDDHVARNVSLPLFLVGFSGRVLFPAAALLAGRVSVQYLLERLRRAPHH